MVDFQTMIEGHKKYSNPAYFFDLDELDKRISGLFERMPKNASLCYAIKANPFLVRHLKNTISPSGKPVKFEACSRGELEICASENVDMKNVVFSGVMKTYDDVFRAVSLGAGVVTLESKEHLRLLLEVMEKVNVSCISRDSTTASVPKQNVILRLSSGNQFGMSENDFFECVEKLKNAKNVHIAGVHYFSGTQKKMAKIREEIDFVKDFVMSVQEKTGVSLDLIEYGPGLAVEYFGDAAKDEAENFSEAEEFFSLIKKSHISSSLNDLQWTIELGRYIAFSCGYYVTEIKDVKVISSPHHASLVAKGSLNDHTQQSNFIIIDGGINHINYFGSMLGMKAPKIHHIDFSTALEVTGKNEAEAKKWTVSGSLCTTADVIVRSLELKNPKIGDYLIFCNIGAYSVTEGIYLFLSHALPAIFTAQGGKVLERRERVETWEKNR